MEKITEENIKLALERSGYLLENEVLEIFQGNDYWSEANHTHFIDPVENKFRELDVRASKNIFCGEAEKQDILVNVNFLVECINNSQPLAIFENIGDRDRPGMDWYYKMVNFEVDSREQIFLDIDYQIEEISKFEKYIAARQYCGFTKKGNSNNPIAWMALHPQDFHETLIKLVQFTKQLSIEIDHLWEGRMPSVARLEFMCPIIVLQGELIKISNKEELKIDQIKFHRLKFPFDSTIQKNIAIDIVTKDYLDAFLKERERDLYQIYNLA